MDTDLFAQRREAFFRKIDRDAVVILPGNSLVCRNLDTPYPFRQQSDFYYLTGYDAPDAVAVFVPNNRRYRFVLFVHRPTEREILYDGRAVDTKALQQQYGATAVYFTDQMGKLLPRIVKWDRPIYYPFGHHPKWDEFIVNQFVTKRSGGQWPIMDPLPIIHELRRIKTAADFSAGLQEAIAITGEGLLAGIRAVQPGKWEYQIQAEIEYMFRQRGAQREAFQSIIASGPNAGILHYVRNNRQLQAGDLVLMDCGAEVNYYCGDLTRTVPVSGRFTPEQRQIYELVLRAQQTGIAHMKPGVTRKAVTEAIDNVLQEGLKELGLIEREADFKIFTIHGYIHWLGMDVHDVGGYTRRGVDIPFQPGMVMTIEPGVYVREDALQRLRKKGVPAEQLERIAKKIKKYLNIGVRIEDNIVITEDGNRNLSAEIPKTVEDIESLMRT